MTIHIANVQDLGPPSEWPEWVVYVGRRSNRHGLKASLLENPYRVGQWAPNGMRRPSQMGPDDCIDAYAVWLRHRCTAGVNMELGRLRSLLEKHGKLTLVCWCAPKKRCHAEVVRKVLQGMLHRLETCATGGRGDE